MICPEPDRIQDCLDRRLPSGEAAAVRAHLRECRECAREAEALAAVGVAIRALAGCDPGAEFTARVLQRVRALPPVEAAGRLALSLSAAELAAVGALCAAGALLLSPAAAWLGVSGIPWPSLPLQAMAQALADSVELGIEALTAAAPAWPAWALPAAAMAGAAALAPSLAARLPARRRRQGSLPQ